MSQPNPTPGTPFPGPCTSPVFPATQQLTVVDPLCGHLPGEAHDDECAYWRGVALGEYPAPDAYAALDGVVTIPPHLLGLLPLTDTALRSVA